MMKYLERISEKEKDMAVFKCHHAQYKFTKDYVFRQTVLDAGCGNGYGAYYLSRWAERVIGLDISAEAITYAQAHHQRENIQYVRGHCALLPFHDHTFDMICSFEVIEHIPDYSGFLAEMERTLKPGGMAVISTPNKQMSFSPVKTSANPYHLHEFSAEDFKDLLRPHFRGVTLYGQKGSEKLKEVFQGNRFKRFLAKIDFLGVHRFLPEKVYEKWARILGFAIQKDITEDDYFFVNSEIDTAEQLVAVCKKE
jgi:ubiquinone/menaquinone biosynthesis C-methylase UbiE